MPGNAPFLRNDRRAAVSCGHPHDGRPRFTATDRGTAASRRRMSRSADPPRKWRDPPSGPEYPGTSRASAGVASVRRSTTTTHGPDTETAFRQPGADRVGRIRPFACGRRACSLGPCRRWFERGRCRAPRECGSSGPGRVVGRLAPTRSALVGPILTDGSRGCAEHRERGADVALPNVGGQVGFGRAAAPGRGGLAAGGRLTAPAGERRPGLRLGRRDPQLGVLGAARTVHLVDRDPRA